MYTFLFLSPSYNWEDKNMKSFTQKDLNYICDMFSWNENALKIANDYYERLEGENEQDVLEILEEIIGLHYENLHKCISV